MALAARDGQREVETQRAAPPTRIILPSGRELAAIPQMCRSAYLCQHSVDARRVTFRKPIPSTMPLGFSVADARRNGITAGQLRNPAFGRPFFGTRTRPGSDDGLLPRCHSLASRMSPGVAFSHTTAALLLGAPLPAACEPGPLHVMSPAPVRALRCKGVAGHEARLEPEDILLTSGLPVTTPERTWCDLAAVLEFPDLVAVGDYLLCWENPKTTVERMQDAVIRYPSQRGRAVHALALAALSSYSRSRPESLLRVQLVASPLPDPIPNFGVRLARSGRNIEIDLAYPDYKVGVEYQGDHHRTDRAQWRGDIRRGNDAVDEGWSMIYFTGDDTDDLPAVVSRVERRLWARGWVG